MKTLTRLLCAAAVLLGAATAARAQVPPANSFASRGNLGSAPHVVTSGSNLGASAEASEPAHAGLNAAASVWWTWTAPAAANVRISTAGSAIDTRLAVYTGTAVAALTRIAENDDASPADVTSAVEFTTTAGRIYAIAVDGYAGQEGDLLLSIRLGSAGPANNSFAARTLLTGASAAVVGSNVGASAETGEPAHAGSPAEASVWWRWTPSANFAATFRTTGSSFPARIAVYTGSAVNALTPVASGAGEVSFSAASGTAYVIAVDGAAAAAGFIRLALTTGAPVPANDAFAAAAVLSTAATGNNIGATAEAGEPAHAGTPAASSVWWKWTAPASGVFTVSSAGSAFAPRLAVYTGASLGSLTSIGSSTAGTLEFTAAAGGIYAIAVDGASAGGITLAVAAAPPPGPANDQFAARTDLGSAASASVSASNEDAGAEAGEPAHAGFPAGTSVWWQWTAPGPGTVTISTTGSSFDTRLAVYSGTSLAGLTLIAENDDAVPGQGASAVTFPVLTGTACQIAVDGFFGGTGNVALSVVFTPAPEPPANDAFAAAINLGDATQATGTNAHATAEAGEPTHADDPANASVWWKWTAPGDGTLVISTAGSSLDTVLGIYTGGAVNALTLLAANDDVDGASSHSRVQVIAAAGTTYFIAVDGYGTEQGAITLGVNFAPLSLVNDQFESRTNLGAASTAGGSGNLALGSAEANEPAHAGQAAARSAWWAWTAPYRGEWTLAVQSAQPVRAAVYTGQALDALTAVAQNAQAETSGVAFTAETGTVYLFALDGGAQAAFQLTPVPPPVNDAFSAAAPLGDTPMEISLTQATAEEYEPAHAGYSAFQSVWYTFTATAQREVITLSTEGSTADTVIAVYASAGPATLISLDDVAGNDDASAGVSWSEVVFRSTPGTTYFVAVDTADALGGAMKLLLTRRALALGDNDAFADAIELRGLVPQGVGNNATATAEPGEPAHSGIPAAASVWWQWTAPFSTRFTVSSAASSIPTRIAAYTGTSLAALTPIEAGSGQISFNAVKDATYFIAVDSAGESRGAVAVSITPAVAPANDSIANAASLSTAAQAINVLATAEAGEPAHAGSAAAKSLWWQWTVPNNGIVTIRTDGSSFDTRLAVYEGSSSVGIIGLAAQNDNNGLQATSLVRFGGVAGRTYLIAVDGSSGAAGVVQLAAAVDTNPPANDAFQNAILIQGVSGTASGSNFNATAQPGERAHAGQTAASSVWWKWTAPAAGEVRIDTAGSELDTRLAIYTGSDVAQLAVVGENDDAAPGTVTSRVTFTAQAGATYLIAVDRRTAREGFITLQLAHLGARMAFDDAMSAALPGASAADRSPGADPDGDGTANALEYLFGGPPDTASPPSLTITAAPEAFTLTYPRRDGLTRDLELLEGSADLHGWQTVPRTLQTVQVSENGADPDTFQVTIPRSAGFRFFRLRMTLLP